jgi:hypothetical protein
MSRWNHAPEIIDLAGELGVGSGAPVDGILDHCRDLAFRAKGNEGDHSK